MASGSPLQLFPGFIDDVRAYNRALLGTEITTIYNNGVNGIPGGTLPSFGPGASGSCKLLNDQRRWWDGTLSSWYCLLRFFIFDAGRDASIY